MVDFPDAVVGAIFGVLLAAAIDEVEKVTLFKSHFKDLMSTLERLNPLIKDIDRLHKRLGHRKNELKFLEITLIEAQRLAGKCSGIWNCRCLKWAKYTDKIEKINKDLLQFVQLDLQLLLTREVLQIREDISRWQGSAGNQREDSRRQQTCCCDRNSPCAATNQREELRRHEALRVNSGPTWANHGARRKEQQAARKETIERTAGRRRRTVGCEQKQANGCNRRRLAPRSEASRRSIGADQCGANGGNRSRPPLRPRAGRRSVSADQVGASGGNRSGLAPSEASRRWIREDQFGASSGNRSRLAPRSDADRRTIFIRVH